MKEAVKLSFWNKIFLLWKEKSIDRVQFIARFLILWAFFVLVVLIGKSIFDIISVEYQEYFRMIFGGVFGIFATYNLFILCIKRIEDISLKTNMPLRVAKGLGVLIFLLMALSAILPLFDITQNKELEGKIIAIIFVIVVLGLMFLPSNIYQKSQK